MCVSWMDNSTCQGSSKITTVAWQQAPRSNSHRNAILQSQQMALVHFQSLKWWRDGKEMLSSSIEATHLVPSTPPAVTVDCPH